MISLALSLIILNSITIFFFKDISQKFKIEDSSDGVRKFQKIPVSLLGGTLILSNILVALAIDYFFYKNLLFEKLLSTNREYFSFVVGIIILYLFGLYDDKYKLSANYKLLISTFFLIFFILIDNNLIIHKIEFSFLKDSIHLKSFSFFFTLLCFLLFINALNMFDGINCQVGSYCILVFSIFLFKNITPDFCLVLIISTTFYLILNFKNKIYLGESGILILAFIISYLFVKTSGLDNKAFFADEIFMIMALPGIDMFRLFILRLVEGRHPFSPDTKHIHHLISKHTTNEKTWIVIFFYNLITIISYYLIEFKLAYLIIYLIVYLLIIFLLTKKK